MPRYVQTAGVVAGLVAAAATTGALMGIGHRLYTPALPFNAIASLVAGRAAIGAVGISPGITVLGVIVHFVACIILGIAFVYFAGPDGRAAAWSAVGVAAASLVATIAAGKTFGVGLAAVASIGDLVIVAAVLAAALFAGWRVTLRTVVSMPPTSM